MTNLLPLVLTSRAQNARLPVDHFSETDSANQALRKQILERDRYTCRYCGIRFFRHMEVAHIDGDHTHNHPDNLAAIDPLCHQVQHLAQAGYTDGGRLVVNPFVSQTEINLMSLACWFILDHTTTPPEGFSDHSPLGQADASEQVTGWQMRQAALALLGSWEADSVATATAAPMVPSEPIVLAKLLDELETSQPAIYADRAKHLAGIRLLPKRERFNAQCRDWWPELSKSYPLNRWNRALARFLSEQKINPEGLWALLADGADLARQPTR